MNYSVVLGNRNWLQVVQALYFGYNKELYYAVLWTFLLQNW